jgi:hypothetical protein
MVLRLRADKIDEIPEGLRPKAKDVAGGGYEVADLGGYEVEKVDGLRTALGNERQVRVKLRDALRAYGYTVADDGTIKAIEGEAIDAQVARDALEKVRTGKLQSPEAIEDFKRQFSEKLETERAEWRRKLSVMEKAVADEFVDREAMAQIKALGGNDATAKLIMPIVRLRTKVELTDGRVSAVALNDKGQPIISKKSGSTDPMGIAEFVATLKQDKDYASAWPVTTAGGSGGGHQTAGGSVQGVQDRSQLRGGHLLEHLRSRG